MRKAEITTTTMILLILGIIAAAVIVYLLFKGSGQFGATTECSGEINGKPICSPSILKGCPKDYSRSMKACRLPTDKGKEFSGRCCVEDLI